MKAKNIVVGGVITVCALFDGLDTGNIPSRSYVQPEIRLDRIALMSFFRGRYGTNTSETLDIPISDIHFNTDNVSIDSDRVITNHVWRYGERIGVAAGVDSPASRGLFPLSH